jgi:hypothetical protein
MVGDGSLVRRAQTFPDVDLRQVHDGWRAVNDLTASTEWDAP